MSQCEAPVINKVKVCDSDIKRIKEILNTDSRAPFIAFTFDEVGNLTHFTSDEEFNLSPFDLKNQRFKSIVPASFIVSEGTHSVTASIAGESTTTSLP